MSKLYYCIGRKSEQPFTIPGSDVAVSTIEELCYYIRRYTETIDREFMKDEVADFMEHIGFEGAEMKQLIHFNGSLTGFCEAILEQASSIPSLDEWTKIKSILIENEKMTPHARMQKQADQMLDMGEYVKALSHYGRLLDLLTADEDEIKEGVLMGMGQSYVELFYFDLAAESFLKCYEIAKNEKALKYYLLCNRMIMSKAEYVDFIAKHPEYYEKTLELESFYEKCLKELDLMTEQLGDMPECEGILKQFRKMVG